MRCWSIAVAVAMELALRGISLAADPRFPDWPCNQIKVPEIPVAAVWTGPSIDDVGNAWEEGATLTDRVEWDTRIFEERRKTMNFVCEVPVLIEHRLFALARAIQQSLE